MAKSKAKSRVIEDVVEQPEAVVPEVEDSEPEIEGGKDEEQKPECRACIHYPVSRKKTTTSLVESIRIATNKWRKTYCGTQPVHVGGKLDGKPIHPDIDCRQKTFEPIKK